VSPRAALAGLRLVATGWLFTLKNLSRSGFFVMTSVVQPLLYATIAFFLFRAGARPGTLLYVAIGAGMMGIWSATLFGSGGTITWARFQGTLEPLVAAPAPFALVLLPTTLASSTVGLYSLVATVAWGRLLFGVPLRLAHPAAFLVAVPATVLALGMLGLLLGSTFVFYRYANALMNMLEYPVWLVSGVLVPLAHLPRFAAWISWPLAPTWGMAAIRGSALGGGHPWRDAGIALGLGLAYLAAATPFLRIFLRAARERATLALA